MAAGHWSFLHEWAIYDYILARASEKTLRFKSVIRKGNVLVRSSWVKVEHIAPFFGTRFPDVKEIKLKGHPIREAEVKFRTSMFNYHREGKYRRRFNEFRKNDGLLLVLSHDYISTELLKLHPTIDVFEIELEDFVTFCRENFGRLLNRQIKAHNSTRIWIMYQGPNFNESSTTARPARKSRLWCPTENLTGFDIAAGDTILFIKTAGVASQDLQKQYYKDGSIDNRWILKEVFIAQCKSKIFGRQEFNQIRGYNATQALWKNDPVKKGAFRWNRVFEFELRKSIAPDLKMSILFEKKNTKTFVQNVFQAYCFGKSREIGLSQYQHLLESLL